MKDKIATHRATVLSAADGQVQVRVMQVSGCAACAAHSKCGFADQKEKTVTVATPDWQTYTAGESVMVSVTASRGLQAVLIAYILPAVLLVAVVASLHYGHVSDLWSSIAALGAVVLYCAALYLSRHRLQRRFDFGIQHLPVH